jgi:hypothetical protein
MTKISFIYFFLLILFNSDFLTEYDSKFESHAPNPDSFCNKLIDNGIFDITKVDSESEKMMYVLNEYHSFFSQNKSNKEEMGIDIGIKEMTESIDIGYDQSSISQNQILSDIRNRSIFKNKTWFKLSSFERRVSDNLKNVLESCVSGNRFKGNVVAYTELESNDAKKFTLHLSYKADTNDPLLVKIKVSVPDQRNNLDSLSIKRLEKEIVLHHENPIEIPLFRNNTNRLRLRIESRTKGHITPIADDVISVIGQQEIEVWNGIVTFQNDSSDPQSNTIQVDMREEDLSTWTEDWYDQKGRAFKFIDNPNGDAQYGYITTRGSFGVVSQIGKNNSVKAARKGPTYTAGKWIKAQDSGGHWVRGIKVLEKVPTFY